jgi:hypothetical protein
MLKIHENWTIFSRNSTIRFSDYILWVLFFLINICDTRSFEQRYDTLVYLSLSQLSTAFLFICLANGFNLSLKSEKGLRKVKMDSVINCYIFFLFIRVRHYVPTEQKVPMIYDLEVINFWNFTSFSCNF